MSEHQENGRLRLRLVGELDLSTVPMLEDRLRVLREQNVQVRLDLSKISFIDSTGVRILFRAVKDGRDQGWPLEVDRELTPPVKRVLGILHLEEFLVGDTSSAAVQAGQPGRSSSAQTS